MGDILLFFAGNSFCTFNRLEKATDITFHIKNITFSLTSMLYPCIKCGYHSFKRFIPRREMRSISSWGPIAFTYVLFWVWKRTLKKKRSPK